MSKRYKPQFEYGSETPAQLINLLITALPYRRTRKSLSHFKATLRFVRTHLERSFDIYKTAYTEASRAALRANVEYLDRQWSAPNKKKAASTH